MAQLRQRDARTGIIYVYESMATWDSAAKKTRYKKTCIGKIDEETGQIVPTGKRGRPKLYDIPKDDDLNTCDWEALAKKFKDQAVELKKELKNQTDIMHTSLHEKDQVIQQLTAELSDITRRYDSVLQDITYITTKYSAK